MDKDGRDGHYIRRESTGKIRDLYELGKRDLVHVGRELSYHETTDIECACGETFEDLDSARGHLVEEDDPRKGLNKGKSHE